MTSTMVLQCPATFHDAVVAAPIVTLGQVADLRCVPAAFRQRLGVLPVATASFGRSKMTFSAKALASHVRAITPAARYWFPTPSASTDTVRFALTGHAAPTNGPSGCVKVLTPVAANSALLQRDIEAAPCGDGPLDRPFRYDRSVGALRALRELSVGEITPRPPQALLSSVRPGDALYVSVAVGPVTVERTVRTLQPSFAHKPVFVRGADGAIFSVPSPELVR